MKGFVVRMVSTEDLADPRCFVLGLAEERDGSGFHLVFQRALSFDEQDRRLGQATYCITVPSGACHYGGVASCVLGNGLLAIRLRREAARALGTGDRLEFPLEVDGRSVARLRSGLERVFGDADQPSELIV